MNTKNQTGKKRRFPKRWDEARVSQILDPYDNQTAAEAAAEDEAMFRGGGATVMAIPPDLVPRGRALIAARARKGRLRPRQAKRVAWRPDKTKG